MQTEYEIKFLAIDVPAVRTRLKQAGATLSEADHLMRRYVFHFSPESVQAGEQKWARARDEGDRVTMTIKQTVDAATIEGTKEIELIVDSFERAADFLTTAGLHVASYQENRRETWDLDGCSVTIDTWPGLEPFVEIEGPDEPAVLRLARTLGFDPQQGAFGSIDLLCVERYHIAREVITNAERLTFTELPATLAAAIRAGESQDVAQDVAQDAPGVNADPVEM